MHTVEAKSICKTILRNGYDTYLINPALQNEINELKNLKEIPLLVKLIWKPCKKFSQILKKEMILESLLL